MTAAAICSLVLGLGFGLPGVVGTLHFARTGTVWTFLGFPAYGGGPFAQIGVPTSVPLLIVFVLVCAAEVAVGMMLLRGVPRAATVSFLLLPVEFAAPYPSTSPHSTANDCGAQARASKDCFGRPRPLFLTHCENPSCGRPEARVGCAASTF